MMRLLLALTIVLAGAQAQALTLKIATISPDGTVWMKELRKAAADIKQQTSGRVKLRFYPGGVMGNDKNVLRKMRVGQLHGGAMVGGGLGEIYPDSQIYSLPFAFRNTDEVDFVRARMDGDLMQGLYERGYVSFGLAEAGFAYLMSNKPISGIADLDDRKVWVPEGDAISQMAFEAVGVSPISLPLPDVLTALQTGLIDTVGASPIGAIALQWHTRVKYVTDTPLMYLYGILIIDRKAFERIKPDDQEIVRAALTDVFKRLNEINRQENEQARHALAGQGIEFIQPSAEEKARWDSAIRDRLIETRGNGYFSQAIVDKLLTNLDAARKR